MLKLFKFIRSLFGSDKNELKEQVRFVSTEPQSIKVTSYSFSESKVILANQLSHLISTGQCKNYIKLSKFISKYGSNDSTPIVYEALTVDKEMLGLLKQMKVLKYKINDEEFVSWLNNVL